MMAGPLIDRGIISSVVPEQRQQDDDRERDSKQPKQQPSTETHGSLHLCVVLLKQQTSEQQVP